jgi:hypothetical protein
MNTAIVKIADRRTASRRALGEMKARGVRSSRKQKSRSNDKSKYYPERAKVEGTSGEKVYFFQGKGTRFYKIGFTRNSIASRFRAINTKSALPLMYVGCVRGPQSLEQKLHQQLSLFRRHGEWFELPDSVAVRLCGYFQSIPKQLAFTLSKNLIGTAYDVPGGTLAFLAARYNRALSKLIQ